MGLFDQEMYRQYKCDSCGIIIGRKEKVSDPWLKKCPHCEKETLFIHSGSLNLSIFIDADKPKTLGSLAEKNTKEKIKSGELEPTKKKSKPFWRKSDKINYDILKNPDRYIKEGIV